MKRQNKRNDTDMLDEYDFSKGTRGKHALTKLTKKQALNFQQRLRGFNIKKGSL